MKTDVEMYEAGWTAEHRQITDIDETITQGIDHVFSNPGPPPMSVVTDSKYGSARLKRLVSDPTIKQMDSRWIDARLEQAVGPRRASQISRRGYSAVVAKIKADGTITYQLLDDQANVIGEFTP